MIDRQGGRFHYQPQLQRALPGGTVKKRRERPDRSDYTITETATRNGSTPRAMSVSFAERAETRSFPVALASCIAKYSRESCMRAFNEYFGELEPGLKPTAGYTTDGRRWLKDAARTLKRAGVTEKQLVRLR